MKIILTFMSVLLCTSVLAQEKTHIIIKPEGFGETHKLRVFKNGVSVDYEPTAEILYEADVLITEPTYYTVSNREISRYTGFWIEPGHGEVTIHKENFVSATEVKGCKSHEVFYSPLPR